MIMRIKNMAFLSILIFGLITGVNLHGQSMADLLAYDMIKRKVIKNIVVKEMITMKKGMESDKYFSETDDFSTLGFIGFGFMPTDVDCKIVPRTDIDYPTKNWKLFDVSFPYFPINDTLKTWSNSKSLLLGKKNILVGINKNNQFICISGCGFNSSIIKDFRIKRNKPKTYISFLKFKYYMLGIDVVNYLRKEGGRFIYQAQNIEADKVFEFEISLDANDPERYNEIKYVGKTYNSKSSGDPLELEFTGYSDKKAYLLDALMKNIYYFKLNRISNIFERLNIDTNSWLIKGESLYIDSMLPDYNMRLNNIDVVTFDLRFAKGKCRDAWPLLQNLIGDEDGDYSTTIVGSSISQGIEFYRIYKDTITVLCEVDRQSRKITDNCMFDYFYLPDTRMRTPVWLEEYGEYLIPDLTNNRNKIYGGEPECLPYNFPVPDGMKGRLNYYLVALDIKTRKVYFVSGKDIYLSKGVLSLYRPEGMEKHASHKNWLLEYKLEYIRDRLYQYQVAVVKRENIINEDDSQIVLLVDGKERSMDIQLKVTFRNDNPEELLIEEIP